MSFNIRLKKILNWSGFNPTRFGDELKNTHRENIRRLLKEKESNPGLRVLEDIIIRFPEINARWLITGEGEMLEVSSSSELNKSAADYKKAESSLEKAWKEVGALEERVKCMQWQLDKLNPGGSMQDLQDSAARVG